MEHSNNLNITLEPIVKVDECSNDPEAVEKTETTAGLQVQGMAGIVKSHYSRGESLIGQSVV